ncbi:MAG: DNA polymerase III subunit alpha [Candidatus Izemoplasmataceae bacterium]
MYTNLYIQSNYEMNGSTITFDRLMEFLAKEKHQSVGLTDSKLYGLLKFYESAKKHGIHPILGLSLQLEGINSNQGNHVLIYAMNEEGYQNLIKLASLQALHKEVSIKELATFHSQLACIILSKESCLYPNIHDNQAKLFMDEINNIFDEYYVSYTGDEVFDEQVKQRLIYVKKTLYLHESDHEASQVLQKIFNQTKDVLFDGDENNHFYLEEDIEHSNRYIEDALQRTNDLAKKCQVTLQLNQKILPKYPVKKGYDAKTYLTALSYKGLDKRLARKKIDKKKYIDRLEYELRVIDQMGYNDYFLIVWDFVKYAKQKGYLVGPGRGSAAASLVSYCLGITSVDSLEYDLVFERFLNPERISMPDIDMDLPDDKRDDIIEYVRDFYGIDKVASICTFGTFLSKSALRDSARILEVDDIVLKEFLDAEKNYDSLQEMITSDKNIIHLMEKHDKANTLGEVSAKIEHLMRHVSTHAAGVIITEGPLTEYTAVQEGLLDMMQTQYEAKDLEHIGLLKIDFLGLRNLTAIHDVVKMIEEDKGKKIDIYKVPLDNQKTYELLRNVDTTGIFQLESPGMRSLIRQMKPREFEDIVTLLALFRPGPMENIPTYLKRRFQEESITYIHPILEEILRPTSGIIIYQEQIIKIANLFAGYSLGEADLLRRAVSKKQQDILEKERDRFVRYSTKQGHNPIISNEIYDYIVKFANYGFNRAHSVAYAMVSYWMAYLKANYPAYFISVLSSSVIGSEKKIQEFVYEGFKHGIEIISPDVNRSTNRFEPDNQYLLYPLPGVKYVGVNAAKVIIEERNNKKFTSYVDFVSRMHKLINKRVIESLIYAGALDLFSLSKRTMVESLEDVINFSEYGQHIVEHEFVIKQQDEFSFEELREFEHQVLGFNLSMNPLKKYQALIIKHELLKPSELNEKHVGQSIRMAGVIQRIHQITTKTNKQMAFLTISDEFVSMDGVLFSKQYDEYQNLLEVNGVYLLKVKVEKREDNTQLIINQMHRL